MYIGDIYDHVYACMHAYMSVCIYVYMYVGMTCIYCSCEANGISIGIT